MSYVLRLTILNKNRACLDRVADELCENETISGADIGLQRGLLEGFLMLFFNVFQWFSNGFNWFFGGFRYISEA